MLHVVTCVGLLTQILHFSHQVYNYVLNSSIFLTTLWSNIIVYYASMFFVIYKWITFVKNTFSKFIMFRAKTSLNQRHKSVLKNEFHQFQLLCFVNHHYRILSNLESALLIRKNDVWKYFLYNLKFILSLFETLLICIKI
jgi:hypothetical protein